MNTRQKSSVLTYFCNPQTLAVLRHVRHRDPATVSTAGKALNRKVISDIHRPNKLEANDIKSLLQDLDKETTAEENAEEIGSDLLNGRWIKELAIKDESKEERTENLTGENLVLV